MNSSELVLCDVEFSGTESGDFDLTWGQAQMCYWMERAAPHIAHMNLAIAVPIDFPATVADVRTALRMLIERHEALRTRMAFSAAGGYRQVLASSGTLVVEIHNLSRKADVKTILTNVRSLPFSVFEWPVRAAIVKVEGKLSGVVMGIAHTASDGVGSAVISRDLAELILQVSDSDAVGPRTVDRQLIQPREQAAWQRGNQAASARARAERHWRRHLQNFPNTRFPVPFRVPESPRFSEIALESTAGAQAVRRIATRARVTPHAVVLAALSLLLAELGRHEFVTFRLFCSNRLSVASQASVGTYSQTVPVSVAVSDMSFSELIRNCSQASLSAYRSGMCDHTTLDTITESAAYARGVHFDLECIVSLLDNSGAALSTSDSSDPTRPTQARIYKTSGGLNNWETEKFYINVWEVSEVLRICLFGDTALFGSEQLAQYLEYLERVLLTADAQGDLTARQIREKVGAPDVNPIPAGVEYLDGCWIDLAQIESLIVDTLSPRAAKVVLDTADPQSPTLVAYVCPGEEGLTVDEAHRSIVAGLPGRRFVMAPQWYVFCARPAAGDSIDAWQGLPVEAQGSGRS